MAKDINMNGFKHLVRLYGSPEKIPLEDLSLVQDSVWMHLPDEIRTALVPIFEEYWQKEGFPYPKSTNEDIKEEYDRLVDFDVDSLWVADGKELMQNNLGMNIANCFHPHKYHVKCKNYRPPYANFENKEAMRKIIFKTMKFSGNPLRRTGFRNMISIYSGTHSVSNFRPTVAKYIYTKHCPVGGKVLDPSLGYSGRLMGALTSHISHYEGCDPCVATFEGNKKLLQTIQNIESKRNKLSYFMDEGEFKTRLPNVVLHNIPFEDYKGPSDFFDLAFTSPPYFDTERYSNEDTQSWKRFPKYEQWVNGFLFPFIKTSHRVLKQGGKLILNIYGKVNGNCLEDDALRIAKDIFGHTVDDTVFMQMSKVLGIKDRGVIENRNDRGDHKIEPLLIFLKN